jgi:chemotaxis protein methyltransferase CheR
MYTTSGVNLHLGKEELVKARLARRLRALSLSSFDDYIKFVQEDKSGREMIAMIDSLTTNKTSFFREAQHFDYLQEDVLPVLTRKVEHGGKLRFWSAGCSTGEEPYTLGMVLSENVPNVSAHDVRILATDISVRVLERAKNATYSEDTLVDVPRHLVTKYFDAKKTDTNRMFTVKEKVSSLVRFARLNLMENWPMTGPFDAIFCRNVMIYFDKPTQQALINRFWELLEPGGLLFVGHSESLTATAHRFRYVRPAIYAR